MPTVNSDISREMALTVLSRFRGRVTKARLTYPERAAIDLTDDDGGEWYLATWWSDYSPADPEVFNHLAVTFADLRGAPGELVIGFSDGSTFTITPAPDEGDDAIENWELFTPDGRVLSYGPHDQWGLGSADDLG
jgi:hypothetical protein